MKMGKHILLTFLLECYKIVEATAPEGFVLNVEAQTVTFTYKDQETPVIEQEAVFQNERQKVEVSVVKKRCRRHRQPWKAQSLGCMPKRIFLAHGEVIVKADTLIGKALSDENGKAVFMNDLPFGRYLYQKKKPHRTGIFLPIKVVEVTAEYQGQEIPVVELASEYENEPTKISVKKTDLTTGVELEGAKLAVLDQDGNIVDSWTSVKGEEHLIERLTVGETYTLREELAPYGYLKAEEITFTVEDTAEIQKVEMKDDVPEGALIINKKGEFLEDVTLVDTIGGWISHIFEYITGALKDVTFERICPGGHQSGRTERARIIIRRMS